MKDGLYSVAFGSQGDAGTGTVTIIDGRVTGGDTSFAYVGKLQHEGNGVTGVVNVFRHSPGLASVLPGIDNYQLTFSGSADGNETALLNGETPSAPGATLLIALRLIFDVAQK